jgi:hypothetical protein
VQCSEAFYVGGILRHSFLDRYLAGIIFKLRMSVRSGFKIPKQKYRAMLGISYGYHLKINFI